MNNKERKFFELSVLGILASREEIQKIYNKSIDDKQTIEEYFIENEQIEKIDIDFWKEKHQDNINRIRSLATAERIQGFGSRQTFLQWYLDHEKVCCYCGINENLLGNYFNSKNAQYVNARQRGKYLEIERLVTAGDKNLYLPENTDLACYVCNNAKSDFLSPKDFKPIAKGINIFWNKVLSKEEYLYDDEYFDKTVKFPEDSAVWNK